MPEREQPDILDPARTRPRKPASPATVPMPGREAPGEVREQPRREGEEEKREER